MFSDFLFCVFVLILSTFVLAYRTIESSQAWKYGGVKG